jgi:hypothetical protein
VRKIERSLTYSSNKLSQYNISINPDKTDGIRFSYHINFGRPTHFRLGRQINPFLNQLKYLGITLDRHLTYLTHFRKKNILCQTKGESTIQTVMFHQINTAFKTINFQNGHLTHIVIRITTL